MKIIRSYMHNPLRNYNYLVVCEQTKKALAIDPFDSSLLLNLAQSENADITMILNTHEHHDHVAGNQDLSTITGAPVYAHQNASVPCQTHYLKGGETLSVGNLRFDVLYTPGHTSVHVCLLCVDETNQAHLFSGDTLFNACVGNCHNGGSVDDMYATVVYQIEPLPDSTKLYPGHDYMVNNLNFALNREENNTCIREFLSEVGQLTPEEMPIRSLGEERQCNPFFRLQNKSVREGVREQFPTIGDSDKDIFVALRKLRDKW